MSDAFDGAGTAFRALGCCLFIIGVCVGFGVVTFVVSLANAIK